MSILGNDLLLAGTDEGYNLTRSLRFRSSASAYLSRTPATTTNRRTWTVSCWIKRGRLATGTEQVIFGSNNGSTYTELNYLASSDVLRLNLAAGGSAYYFDTSAVFRDPSAWYHIVVAVDTTQATSTDRMKVYINGVQQTGSNNTPAQNYDTDWNRAQNAFIGSRTASTWFNDCYLAEFYNIDGLQLTPSSFGSTNTLTGVWQPARYTGTYGTNGFYLPFTDNSALTTSSNVGLGKDFSGNGNYWTTNNISITAGVTYDSMTDVPTLTSATAANFAVLNPLDKYSSITVSGGNLNAICADVAWRSGAMTFGNFTTGKWYYEVTATNIGGSTYISAGWELSSFNHTAQTNGVGAATGNNFGVLISTGLRQTKVNSSIFSSDSNANANGDVLMIAVDFDAGKGWVGKNGTWYDSGNPSAGTNPCTTTVSGGMTPAYQMYNNGGLSANFGQRPFTYTPPTGFVALNVYNLPTSTIVKGNTVMDATLWSGSGSSQTITNAAAFKPDFVWAKARNNTSGVGHMLADSVRGGTNVLHSDSTSAEQNNLYGAISSFNSNGFTTASGSVNSAEVHQSGFNYVGWQWQAGQGTTSSNTNGTITSTVSVNASAGFSVVTYTGTGANATVGHGLGVAPSLIICKSRGASTNWGVWHASLTSYSYFLLLNSTAAQATAANTLQALPTSTLVSLGASSIFNDASTMVMYAWTPIAGYSAFGSYTGNGSSDGTFVYTGFRPKFIMIKRSDSAGNNWRIWDTARAPYNAGLPVLYPNTSDAEDSITDTYDLLSNGFKLRTSAVGTNASGGTYIYAAFAENPFKNSLAR